jgi:hypothetical protein
MEVSLRRRINVYAAKRYVIAARTRETRRKIFHIAFGNKDGSVYVSFPYFRPILGRVGCVHLDPDMGNGDWLVFQSIHDQLPYGSGREMGTGWFFQSTRAKFNYG